MVLHLQTLSVLTAAAKSLGRKEIKVQNVLNFTEKGPLECEQILPSELLDENYKFFEDGQLQYSS